MSDNVLATEQPVPNGSTPEEPTLQRRAPESTSDPKLFTEEDLNKARQQEKDKLYKRLETMTEQVKRLEEESKQRAEAEEARQREIQQQQEEAAKLAEQQQESEMSAKDLLAKKESEWAEQMSQMRQEMAAERALREREAEFNSLMEHRQQVIQAYQDKVAPELLDLIQGSTPDEINQSAEDMAARSARILEQTQQAMNNVRQQTPTARITAPASGENAGSQQTFTPEQIRNMSMADYAKHRQALLGKGTDGGKARGIFG